MNFRKPKIKRTSKSFQSKKEKQDTRKGIGIRLFSSKELEDCGMKPTKF